MVNMRLPLVLRCTLLLDASLISINVRLFLTKSNQQMTTICKFARDISKRPFGNLGTQMTMTMFNLSVKIAVYSAAHDMPGDCNYYVNNVE